MRWLRTANHFTNSTLLQFTVLPFHQLVRTYEVRRTNHVGFMNGELVKSLRPKRICGK